jgi:Mg-chelatase subunit ChlD
MTIKTAKIPAATQAAMLIQLQSEIEEAKAELEELEEGGDLEDRLEAAFRLEELEAKLRRATKTAPQADRE